MEIKISRVYLQLQVVDELLAIRDRETSYWKLQIKMKDGRVLGVKTAIKKEKIYKKFDTLIDQIDEMLGCPLKTIKVI